MESLCAHPVCFGFVVEEMKQRRVFPQHFGILPYHSISFRYSCNMHNCLKLSSKHRPSPHPTLKKENLLLLFQPSNYGIEIKVFNFSGVI